MVLRSGDDNGRRHSRRSWSIDNRTLVSPSCSRSGWSNVENRLPFFQSSTFSGPFTYFFTELLGSCLASFIREENEWPAKSGKSLRNQKIVGFARRLLFAFFASLFLAVFRGGKVSRKAQGRSVLLKNVLVRRFKGRLVEAAAPGHCEFRGLSTRALL